MATATAHTVTFLAADGATLAQARFEVLSADEAAEWAAGQISRPGCLAHDFRVELFPAAGARH